MRTAITTDADSAGREAAELVLAALAEKPVGEPFLLGCPGGRSPRGTYRALAQSAAYRRLNLSHVTIVMMDDYVEFLDGHPRRVGPDLPHSCERFGRREILGVLNQGLPLERRIAPANLWLPDPSDPAAYDARIEETGGIDVFILASGASDGHIAFNPPGSEADSITRLVTLPDSTRRDNLVTFPSFGGSLAAVPTHGVTVGLSTIRDLSRRAVMVVHGADKVRATSRIRAASALDPEWPATIVTQCRDAHLVLDRAAAGVDAD